MRRTSKIVSKKKNVAKTTKAMKYSSKPILSRVQASLKIKELKPAKASIKIKKQVPAAGVPLLSTTCEVEKQPLKPEMALPPKCGIQSRPPKNLPVEDNENLAILKKSYSASTSECLKSSPANLPGPACKSFWNFCLSPRASFWLGVFFGVTVMGFLVVTAWTLFSADLVNASILR